MYILANYNGRFCKCIWNVASKVFYYGEDGFSALHVGFLISLKVKLRKTAHNEIFDSNTHIQNYYQNIKLEIFTSQSDRAWIFLRI